MVTVKIGKKEHEAMKALAKQRNQYLTYHLNEAIRLYLEVMKQKTQTA